MTSDTYAKEEAVKVPLSGGRTIIVGGMAKGAGMINPNMATMLCLLSTNAPVEKKDLQRALAIAVEQSFNRITVDGDMSTNDTVILLANGSAGGTRLGAGTEDFERFQNALNHVTRQLARLIVEDGGGDEPVRGSARQRGGNVSGRPQGRRSRGPTPRSSNALGTAVIPTGDASSMPSATVRRLCARR